jgi:hypothetical protein
MIELSRPFSPRAAKDSYGASSPIRRVVSHRLQSAERGHSWDPERARGIDPKAVAARSAAGESYRYGVPSLWT